MKLLPESIKTSIIQLFKDNSLEEAKKWAQEHKGLTIKDLDDKEGYKKVEEAHKLVKKTRSTIENTRKDIKKEILEVVDGHPKEILGVLAPIEEELAKTRSDYETKLQEKKEQEYKDKLQPLLDAGLEEIASDKYAIGQFFLTKKEVEKADDGQLMVWIIDITDEATKIEKERKEKEELEALIAKQEAAEKAKVHVEEVPEKETFSSGPDTTPMVSKAMEQATPKKAIPPQLGKYRSSISELQDIYDAIAAMPKNDPELKTKVLELIKNRINEIKAP